MFNFETKCTESAGDGPAGLTLHLWFECELMQGQPSLNFCWHSRDVWELNCGCRRYDCQWEDGVEEDKNGQRRQSVVELNETEFSDWNAGKNKCLTNGIKEVGKCCVVRPHKQATLSEYVCALPHQFRVIRIPGQNNDAKNGCVYILYK